MQSDVATNATQNHQSTAQTTVENKRKPLTNEEKLDQEFFAKPTTEIKKMKLNKGEKRALKFGHEPLSMNKQRNNRPAGAI